MHVGLAHCRRRRGPWFRIIRNDLSVAGRNQPDSALSRWFRERVGQARGLVRRIAIVAVARRLLVALWRYVETGLVPTGAVLKA